jgi:hypothetical protein
VSRTSRIKPLIVAQAPSFGSPGCLCACSS